MPRWIALGFLAALAASGASAGDTTLPGAMSKKGAFARASGVLVAAGESEAQIAELERRARALAKSGRHAEAITGFRRLLEILEDRFGPRHRRVGQVLRELADIHRYSGLHEDAVALYLRALEIFETTLGNQHADTTTVLNNLAMGLENLDRLAEAEKAFRRAAEINETHLGDDHPYVGINLNNLARVLIQLSRFTEAEKVFERSLAILRKAGPDYARSLNAALVDFGYLYQFQNRLGEAEAIYRKALLIAEKRAEEDPSQLANNLNNLALILRRFERFDEAEALYRRAVSLLERGLGQDHPRLVVALNNLARLYWWQNRFEDAHRLYARALDIARRKMTPDSTLLAVVLNNFSEVFSATGRHAEAEDMATRALAIREQKLGKVSYRTGQTLNRLGEVYHDQGRAGEARDIFRRALSVWETVLGPEHYEVAHILMNLGDVSLLLGDREAAARAYRRAGDVRLGTFGADHPLVAESRVALAGTLAGLGRYQEAMYQIRQAAAGVKGQVNRILSRRHAGDIRSSARLRDIATTFVAVAEAMADDGPTADMVGETFEVAQLVHATGTATALANMAARFGAGGDELANVVRARQDSLGELVRLDGLLIEGLGRKSGNRSEAAEIAIQDRMAALSGELKKLDATLARDFPAYAELASPAPVSLAEIQSLLGAEEALLTFLVGDEASYLWVVRHDRAAFHPLRLGAEDIFDWVTELRFGLDATATEGLKELPSFDTKLAHRIYEAILAPAEPLLAGVRHLMVVKDQALHGLALGVLLTEEPPAAGPSDLSGYRALPWLIRRYATTVLPSVSSLRALRLFARDTDSQKPFVGFGDPSLEGPPGRTRGIDFSGIYRGDASEVDLDTLRNLPPLPETADELRSMANDLHSTPDSVFLRDQATETTIKAMDLSNVRIVAFATHAVVAGELSGVAEPALVFSPPKRASPLDDGLLTSSEVAQLKMNADWVILSACNTAAGDGSPDAMGLSGLAKAFFYAGSRALLVSHWPVFSDAAAKLTSGTFRELARDPSIGRSEALRRSEIALMSDAEHPAYAHPIFWAPFFVVGEGGARQSPPR